MDTAMQAEIRNSEATFQPLREASTQAFEDGNLVRPEDSANKLLQLIEDAEFISGSHLDFYDDMPGDEEDGEEEEEEEDEEDEAEEEEGETKEEPANTSPRTSLSS